MPGLSAEPTVTSKSISLTKGLAVAVSDIGRLSPVQSHASSSGLDIYVISRGRSAARIFLQVSVQRNSALSYATLLFDESESAPIGECVRPTASFTRANRAV